MPCVGPSRGHAFEPSQLEHSQQLLMSDILSEQSHPPQTAVQGSTEATPVSHWCSCSTPAAGMVVQPCVPLLQGVHGMWELCISKAQHADVEEERLEAVVASLHSPHTLVRPRHQSGQAGAA